jgi:large subunit ribosomal protein L5
MIWEWRLPRKRAAILGHYGKMTTRVRIGLSATPRRKDCVVKGSAVVMADSSVMQAPKLEKIVLNQGLGIAVADKKIIEVAINEMTAITGQKAVSTVSKKDISNFKLRKKMPIGVRVTLRGERMYEFLERLVKVALPRVRDFKGIENKLDGRGNYTMGIQEQIIFPEINIDNINRLLGMNITFVTTAQTDEEGFALLKEFGLPFKKN